jgi:hypothetical protein
LNNFFSLSSTRCRTRRSTFYRARYLSRCHYESPWISISYDSWKAD